MELESSIQRKICNYLILNGYFVTKILKSTTNGIPDLLAIKDGKALFVEVKRPKVGIISEIQKYRIKQLIDFGAVAIVATSVDDIKLQLLKEIK